MVKAPASTQLTFYDGPAKKRLAEVTIPNLPLAGRVNTMRAALVPVYAHMKKRGVVREQADALDLPGSVKTVASRIKIARGQDRLLLLGSPYHSDRDRAATFGHGYVPAIDHILASSKDRRRGQRIV